MSSVRKVIVSGAGIAGLATALALRQRGVAVTVLEQASLLREVGAGLQLGAPYWMLHRAADYIDREWQPAHVRQRYDWLFEHDVTRLPLDLPA